MAKRKPKIALSTTRVKYLNKGAYYITVDACAALPDGSEFTLDELTGIPDRQIATIARYIGRALKNYKPTKKVY